MATNLITFALFAMFLLNVMQLGIAVPFHVENLKVSADGEECKDERDCSWIVTETAKHPEQTLENYCQLNKDTAPIKQCRKTCGMCKAPAPIECKDERDCTWIVTETAKHPEQTLEDYCELNKDTTPIKQCRKTCGMCKAPAPTVCEDERDDCDRLIDITGGGIKLEKYCKKWKDLPAVKKCLKTCNLCPPPLFSRELGMATFVANNRLGAEARYFDSRAYLQHKMKTILAARRKYPEAVPRKRTFP